MNDRQLSRRISRRGVTSQIQEDKAMFREGRQLTTILEEREDKLLKAIDVGTQ